MYDVAVIGGGIVGAFCARELVGYKLSVVVLEAADDVCAGASRANSGIVHAGFDAEYGTLKAKFNIEGSNIMERVSDELGVKFKRIGALVTAQSGQEERIRHLYENGLKNGVKGLQMLDGDAARELEHNLSRNVVSALYAPSAGIICPYGMTIAAIGNAMDNGAALKCGFKVSSVDRTESGCALHSESGETICARMAVNCAGYGAQRVAELFGDRSFKIGARKGEYILLDKSAGAFVSHTIFSVPTKAGKGVLVTPTVDGNLLVGPTSVEEAEHDVAVRRCGFEEIRSKSARTVENIPFGQTITSFAGVRAYCDRHDFIVEQSAVAKELYNVAGIESPGLTSAPAIGRYVAERIAEALGAEQNLRFDPHRKSMSWFAELDRDGKNEVIKRDPAYGAIVCRCENVTLGEILEALRTEPRPHTLDGIKLRTRAGMGRCQGGFCQPSVFNILMKEYGYKAEEVTKNGGKSYIITGGEL